MIKKVHVQNVHVRKPKAQKEKSLLRKFVEVAWEQHKRRKALDLLAKQEWSTDYLIYIISKAAHLQQRGIELVIERSNGDKLMLKSNDVKSPNIFDPTDNILDHLDEPDVVDSYIRRNGPACTRRNKTSHTISR